VSAADLGLVVLVVVALAAVAAMVTATVSLVRASRAMRRSLADLEVDLVAARQAVAAADAGARRAEGAVAQATDLADDLATSSRVVRRIVVNPLVWIVAFFRGVGRAVTGLGGGRRRGRGRRGGRGGGGTGAGQSGPDRRVGAGGAAGGESRP